MWLSTDSNMDISGILYSMFAFKLTMKIQGKAASRYGSQVSCLLWTLWIAPRSPKLSVAFNNTVLAPTYSLKLCPTIFCVPRTLTYIPDAGCYPNLLPLTRLLTLHYNLTLLTSLESQFPKYLFLIYWWAWKMNQNQKPLYAHL